MRSVMANRWRAFGWICVALAWPLSALAETFTLPAGRPVVVRADRATNDPDANQTTFSGHFELQGADWPMQADEAVIYGPVEKPQRVMIQGQPARLWVARKGVERAVAAEADQIEYLPEQSLLRLQGHARLVEGDRRVMEGEQFEYNLKTRKLSQKGRVRISLLPAASAQRQ